MTDPYPFAIDEAFDAYRVLIESGALTLSYPIFLDPDVDQLAAGTLLGMSGKKLNIVISGDSALVKMCNGHFLQLTIVLVGRPWP